MHRLSTRLIALSLPILLAGCATSKPCTDLGERCQAERMLYQNDMLQARLLIASGEQENSRLADALLDRAMPYDRKGEAPFYKALLKIKDRAPAEEAIDLLEQAAKAGQPYATALLYKVYSEPFLVASTDHAKANQYREAYSRLDVAISGYPSFEKALALVDGMLGAASSQGAQAAGR
ncbi:hypothetical protein D3C76_802790 [compost metagenome]